MTFFDGIEKYKKKIAIIDDNSKVSFDELTKQADQLVSSFEPRSLVFLAASNSYESIICYVGLIRAKLPVLIIDEKIENSYLKKLINIYKPLYLILPQDKKEIAEYKKIKEFKNYSILKNKVDQKIKIYKELAILLSTSGTTGSKKLVRLSYDNYIFNINQISKSLKIKNYSVMTTLPMNYTYGLSIITTHLFNGGRIILNQSSIMEKKFWDFYKKYKPQTFYAVPFLYEILKKMNFKKIYQKNLKFMACAGGKLSDNTFKTITKFTRKKKIKFLLMYGQTEASPRMSILHYKNSKKINSIGKPLKGGKFELIDKNNKIIKKNFVEGRLIYLGKNVCLGYANSLKDLSKLDENNGVLKTGDLAFFDNDKYYYITGRSNRIIKIFGLRINLDDVEKILSNLNIVAHCKADDEILKIHHNEKNINTKTLTIKLSKILKLNKNYIIFEYKKSLKNNKILN